jgi:hypothetical protein
VKHQHQHCGCEDELSHLRPGQHNDEEMPEDDYRGYRVRREPPPKRVKSVKTAGHAKR